MNECYIARRRSVAVLCMLYKIRCNPKHPLNGSLPGPYATCSAGYTRCPGRTSLYLCAASLKFPPSQCSSGTILLTPYSMVWDWRVSRALPMLFLLPKLLYPYYSLYHVSLSLLSVYRLVLWSWGLRIDRVYITLSQPCSADLF